MNGDLRDLLTLLATPGLGQGGVRRLLLRYGTPGEALRACPESPNKTLGEKEILLAEQMGVQILPFSSPLYPQQLKDLLDPPFVLYIKGDLTKVDLQGIAVVGTRQASLYGLEMAERLSKSLAQQGMTVVSGLARGIDTAAHRGALQEGRTLAVIGSGLAKIYPSENSGLAREIVERGALISEFSLMTPPHPHNFPRRNRIVSGLTRGTLLIEAPLKSGAMLTMGCAKEQRKRLFAIPGRINNESFRGNHALIKSGDAQLVENAQDIVGAFGELFAIPPSAKKGPELRKEEEELLRQFPEEEVSMDALVAITKFPIQKLSGLLMSLHLKRAIKEYPGKLFRKV